MMDCVLIVDDHPSVREGLASLLIKNRISNKVVEAGNFNEGYRKAVSLNPELILMDISLHGLSGIELSKKLIKEMPHLKIIIISMYSKTQLIVESLNAGVKGYILKESPSKRIIKGINSVINGDVYVDSHISGKVISSLLNKEGSELVVNNESYETLSFREQEILRMLADGLDVNEIADQLCLSVKTVINHRTNIMSKLDCKNTVELIRYAIHIGLIDV